MPPTHAADALLANKKNRALLEPYEERAEAACGYMRLLNPAARVRAGPLTDPQVGGRAAALRSVPAPRAAPDAAAV